MGLPLKLLSLWGLWLDSILLLPGLHPLLLRIATTPLSSRSRSEEGETREEIERTFSPCPSEFLAGARRLSGSCFSGESRLRRAFRAGQWARATIEGRIHSPNRSEQLDLRSRFYVVLRTGLSSTPRAFSSSNSYWRCVGQLSGSSSVSHAFPSEAEARAYCGGAGVDFPTIEA